MNATDNDSGSASLLMDLQVGGVSQFKLSKSGILALASASNSGAIRSNGQLMEAVAANASAYAPFQALSVFVGGSNDIILTRRAAANLRLGAADAAAPVAQTLSVQSVVAGTTNTAGANLTITGSQGTGNAAGGSIIFQVAPAGGSGTAQNALATALTIDSTKLATFEGRVASRFGYTFGSPQFYDASIGSGAGFGVQGAQTSVIYGGSTAVASFEDGANGIRLAGARSLGWVDGHALSNVADVRLWRDAANTLALRNSTAAQTFNLYGTYTDASNYRRAALAMTTAGVATLKPEGAGTGASGNVLHISGLPTSNPGPGILWNNAGTPAIGT
jgi:hypothetical protein